MSRDKESRLTHKLPMRRRFTSVLGCGTPDVVREERKMARRFACHVALFGLLAAMTYPAVGLDLKGLVLYFPFDEGAGGVAKDKGPFALEGKLMGKVQWVAGKYGKAVAFAGPGSTDYIEIAYDPRLDAKDALTVLVWVQPNSWRAACCDQVWGFGVHGGCGGRGQHGAFQEDGLFKVRFEAQGGRQDIATDLPKPKEWTHVAVTYDGAKTVIYINGEKAVEQATPGGALNVGKENPMIAGDCERIPQYIFDGAVDEFLLFHRVLSQDEVRSVMRGIVLAVQARGKLASVWGELKR